VIAGAAGFPSKQTSADSARRAIREVHKGNTFFSPSIPSRLDKRRQEGTQKVPQVVQEKQPIMNSELLNQALEKVGNPNFLVNLISRRVRQLNAGGGGVSRPLVLGTENQGAADIALREIVEGKMGWEIPEPAEPVRPVGRRRRVR
jgi:DNA-directed RNA polymerase subunit omega